MIGTVSSKYALRSLFRSPVRSLLSIIGVGVSCAMALFAASWIRGGAEMQIRAASECGSGHLRIVPDEWTEKRLNSMRLADWGQAIEGVNSIQNVRSVSMRARANGLVAFGIRTSAVEVVGVNPEEEFKSNRVVYKSELHGRYLREDDINKVVIGHALAKRLDVDIDDDLYVTVSGRDEIQSVMLTIVGIVKTGSRDIDASICHTTLTEIERMTGYEGPGEISVLLDSHKLIDSRQKELAQKIGNGNTVITWKEVNPALAANVEGDTAFTKGLVAIIVIVASLGIASAQLTAVLERKHEFAILSALGMKVRQVIGLIVLEALIVGIGGTVVALMVGGSLAYYLATHGVSLAAVMGDNFSIGDVLLDPYMYGDFGIWLVWYAVGISVMSTVVASLYPAWLTTRINPADALRTA